MLLRLYILRFDALVKYATGITGDEEAARDIVQEAFMRVYLKGNDKHAERIWVHTTKNLCINYREHQRVIRKHELSVVEQYDELKDVCDDIVLRLVYGMLDGLPRRERQVFDLIHFKGTSAVGAARVLGIKPSTARVLYKQCIDRFREGVKKAQYY
jgi:RNA polymerase sigma factor (sigma-70 family)